MDHAADIFLFKQAVQSRFLPDIQFIQGEVLPRQLPGTLYGLPVAVAEVIRRHHLIPLFAQSDAGMGAEP